MERTLIILKPDAVQRGLVGKIISRFERSGLKILDCYMDLLTPELANEHYDEHKGKDFYGGLIAFITSGPVLILALEGLGAIGKARMLMGSTTVPGSIRGDFCQYYTGHNLVHGSDSKESAKRELSLFFPKLQKSYTRVLDDVVFGM